MIETNAARVFSQFQNLTHKELGKALKTGLRKALRVIQKDTKSNLSKAFKNTNKKNPKYDDTLQKGVRVTRIYENQDGTIVGKVRIDSTRKTGSGSFRLPILEKGNFRTRPRYTYLFKGKALRKKRKTGDIKKRGYFFKDSVNTNETSFQNNMENEVGKAVNIINGKNLK